MTGSRILANPSMVQSGGRTAAGKYAPAVISAPARPRWRTGTKSVVNPKVTGTAMPSATEASRIQVVNRISERMNGAAAVSRSWSRIIPQANRSFVLKRRSFSLSIIRIPKRIAMIAVIPARSAIFAAISASLIPTRRAPRSSSPNCTKVRL
jgi:hypothetical protein